MKISLSRTWIYLLPVFFLIADAGFTFVIGQLNRLIRRISFVLAFSLMIVADYFSANLVKEDSIRMDYPVAFPVHYYMRNQNKSFTNPSDSNKIPLTYFVIKKTRNKLKDLTDQSPVKILEL